jgi:hypothetical protein
VYVEVRPSLGSHLAASHTRRRVILLDSELLETRGEFERILVHEIFHFAWVRLSNSARQSWEEVLAAEIEDGAPGELGWSAEWRKLKLSNGAPRRRTAAWRRYACESFCDTAAWLYAGLARHEDFTLPAARRRVRREWFYRNLPPSVQI